MERSGGRGPLEELRNRSHNVTFERRQTAPFFVSMVAFRTHKGAPAFLRVWVGGHLVVTILRLQVDYYSSLGVSSDATPEEVSQRQLLLSGLSKRVASHSCALHCCACAIRSEKPQSPYSLYQDCGFMHLIPQCISTLTQVLGKPQLKHAREVNV